MARKAKVTGRANSTKKKRKKGPDSSEEIRKTKSMDELLGIQPIHFTDSEEDGITNPDLKGSELDLETVGDSKVERKIEGEDIGAEEGITSTGTLENFNLVVDLKFDSNAKEEIKKVKITDDDIEEEVNY